MAFRLAVLALTTLFYFNPASAQVTITRGVDMAVDASGDGRIAIDLGGDVWIVPGSGGDARPVTDNLHSLKRPRWSPDGRQLVFQGVVDSRRGLWIFDLERNEMSAIGGVDSFDQHPVWHPNGDRVIFASDSGGSEFDLWEVDVPTGLRWRLSSRPGDDTEPAISSDGRDLVYINRNEDVWSLILRRHSEPEEVLLRSHEELAAPSWRPDGSLITFFRNGSDGASINMVILSEPRLVRQYANDEQYFVAPVSWLDRQRMVYSANGQIRQRQFDSWRSTSLPFRATIQTKKPATVARERQAMPWPDEPSGQLVIRAARLFDGVGAEYRYDHDIVVDGGRVIAVEEPVERPGSIVINMGDLTILPGFVDADARLPGQLAANHGPDLLTMGVTTIVADHANAERLNELWSGKDVPGPRLLPAEQWRVVATARPELDVTAAVVTSRSTGVPAGTGLATQFRAVQTAGLTPVQSLKAVGVNAAAAMLADPYLGRISVGAAADLIFVDGDPLNDVADALNVVAVVRNGRFYSVSGLIDRAKRAETVE